MWDVFFSGFQFHLFRSAKPFQDSIKTSSRSPFLWKTEVPGMISQLSESPHCPLHFRLQQILQHRPQRRITQRPVLPQGEGQRQRQLQRAAQGWPRALQLSQESVAVVLRPRPQEFQLGLGPRVKGIGGS